MFSTFLRCFLYFLLFGLRSCLLLLFLLYSGHDLFFINPCFGLHRPKRIGINQACMQHYDLLYIVPMSVTEEAIPEVMTAVRTIITDNQGTIVKEENLGKKKFGYPIKHQHHGTYVSIAFDAETKHVNEIDRKLRLNSEVLRFLITTRVVRSAEEIKEQEGLRERIQTKRRHAFEKARATADAERAGVEKPDGKVKVKDLIKEEKVEEKPKEKLQAVKKEEKPEVSLEELDKKLDKLLDDDMLK